VRCDGNCVTLSAKAITALLMNFPSTPAFGENRT
jgi:hypothetical protein